MARPDDLDQWLTAHTAGAPATLRARVREHVAARPGPGAPVDRLALAAEDVLALVEEHPGDRSIALDLLSADALITLALLAQAQAEPGRLGAFAESLLAGERIA